ncbi:hypothetical protein [Rhodococcus sp. X156]|uniref:hypothetical protein n=1 Tax=Rhodococcus sp. X156 TaxID=2499145 RepID=UPI000FD7453D|nr:hypothetical protein [Rhodococcus sp. X156]
MDESRLDADGVDDSNHGRRQDGGAPTDDTGAAQGEPAAPDLSKKSGDATGTAARSARSAGTATEAEDGAGDDGRGTGDRQPGRTKVATAAAAVVVAAALLGGAIWYTVDSFSESGPTSVTADRDAAVEAARSVGATMTTVNGGDPQGTLQAWRNAITGELAEQYAQQEAQLTQRIAQTKGSVTSTVTNAALTELDSGAGTASALVFVDTTFTSATPAPAPSPTPAPAPGGSTDPSAAPAPSSPAAAPGGSEQAGGTGQKQRLALTLAMVRTADGWKVSNLQPNEPTQAGQ